MRLPGTTARPALSTLLDSAGLIAYIRLNGICSEERGANLEYLRHKQHQTQSAADQDCKEAHCQAGHITHRKLHLNDSFLIRWKGGGRYGSFLTSCLSFGRSVFYNRGSHFSSLLLYDIVKFIPIKLCNSNIIWCSHRIEQEAPGSPVLPYHCIVKSDDVLYCILHKFMVELSCSNLPYIYIQPDKGESIWNDMASM